MAANLKKHNNVYQKGFTLVEIMVVIAVLAILLGLSSSATSDFLARRNTSNDMYRIYTFLKTAQSRAILEKRNLELVTCVNIAAPATCNKINANITDEISILGLRVFDANDNLDELRLSRPLHRITLTNARNTNSFLPHPALATTDLPALNNLIFNNNGLITNNQNIVIPSAYSTTTPLTTSAFVPARIPLLTMFSTIGANDCRSNQIFMTATGNLSIGRETNEDPTSC